DRQLPILCLLNKSDKLSQNEISKAVFALKREASLAAVQWLPFSGLRGVGVPQTRAILSEWLASGIEPDVSEPPTPEPGLSESDPSESGVPLVPEDI
ncbi:MAG TPA: YihA family ribosome biogenesis GTP-binding protein, partial [Halothiobacillus sp.]|nr:YihA family ribosome biogenesis GTP-binding protein [Halothiobacillus sp.]